MGKMKLTLSPHFSVADLNSRPRGAPELLISGQLRLEFVGLHTDVPGLTRSYSAYVNI